MKSIGNRKRVLKLLSEYFQIALGVLFASIGLKAFLLPNGFMEGGITGISILINTQTQWNVSILLIVLSIPALLLMYFTMARRTLVKSIISIIALAVSIHFETFSIITTDKLLIAIFGGLFMGLGIGITIRNGAVLDGSEVLGIYLNDRYGISIGKVVLVFNVVLFSITALILSVEIAMYSILTFMVTAKVTDIMIEGFEDFIGLMVVSKKNSQIKESILKSMGTGITVYKGVHGYGNNGEIKDFDIIHTVINRIDIRKAYKVIDQIDTEAFVMEFDVNHIKGGVLRRYLNKEKNKQLAPELLKN
ncbi:DUF2179 domain-containing protein [Flavobacteriaceae bacterium R38]|nr:DUF2179 domain-containing protein [Flavobacteriaceae bacterium R38]